MTEVSVRELKNNLAKYLRKAQGGEHILVTSRGKPVASISTPQPAGQTLEDKLARLEAEGFLTRPTKPFKLPKRMIKLRGEGPSMSEMILQDRGEPIP